MVVLNVTYKCKSGKREEFLEAVKTEKIGELCRQEEGNIRYDFYLSAEDPDGMMLLEQWADEGILSKHQQQPHFKRMGELKKDFVEETIFEKYIAELPEHPEKAKELGLLKK